MDNILERLKKKKLEIKVKKDRPIFIKIESKNNRTIYHTKIMNDLYIFGIHRRQKNKFFISFRELFNQDKIKALNLFSIRYNDKFLGIFYGYRKPVQNVVKKYEENGILKMSTFSKVYYIEFRFKKGSVCCYIKGLARLLKKEKIDTKYYKSLVEKFTSLEKQVYEFYDKKLTDGSLIKKWIEKKLQ
ncbi:DUF226 domain-containing protein (plasmid) [Borrelia coriaceae]|uniref:Putative cytosolic protein n=1 Tax=Borrelia coriaceae ATCC 43381 TaxID=1408429 RepID=W5SVP4_9SPIR|nr:DUF226 domain-containing protein [Borrelia coriaceae]AHH11274.1 Putative cytosolic protein [Borrelia coriaceae ATCC 43381]UPA17425.1 DUF226 domain-containing protein [Borrelia coriaceae]